MLQVEDGVDNVPQIVTAGTNFSNAGMPQVLTGNLNGQVYVIGNPTEVFAAQAGTRAIAPRSALVDGTTTVPTNIKKVIIYRVSGNDEQIFEMILVQKLLPFL